ncbi:RNA-directed DNA polymerase, eukaryota [Tanacetum coccineum]
MFSNPHHLWVKVIKALHGIEGGFDYKGCYFNGTWAKIVGSSNYLHSNGFLPSNSLSFKVGSGTRIHFWKDTWIGDSPLCTRYSRIYQLDQDKDCLIMDRFQNGQLSIRTSAYLRDMLNEINQIIPNDVEDSLSEKKMLWDYLIVVIANWNGNVVIMGDFNEVRTQAERYGSIFNVQGADSFNSFILAARLGEVSLASNFDCYLSDHRPILMREAHFDYGPIPFHFFHHWFKMEGFDTFVERTWNEANMSDTNAISKLLKKLKFLKDQTREGNYDILNKRVAISKSLQDIEKLASMEVAQKVKIKWEIEGDENSKYYHAILNKRRCQLPICGILVDGTWIDSLSLVKSEFLSHFTNRFNQPETSRLLLNIDFPNKLNLDQQIDLESDVTHDEIKRVVWDCGIDKYLDPDEFTFGFYRRYWSVLEKDVVQAVSYFFNMECSLKVIIAKILSNRLVVVLGDIVNEVQSAFVVNRQILDGSMPIYHLSLFKAPMKVLQKMESIRCHFFNGIDHNGKKPIWVKWSKVQAFKKKGGLGVSAEKMSYETLGFSLRQNPRGGIEQKQFSKLLASVEGIVLVNMRDRLNISRRGMDIDSILCPSCGMAVESASHVFFTCHIARESVADHESLSKQGGSGRTEDAEMREERLSWFGHAKRRPHIVPLRSVDALIVKGLRRKGRLKFRWKDRIKQDMNELLLSEDMISDRNA